VEADVLDHNANGCLPNVFLGMIVSNDYKYRHRITGIRASLAMLRSEKKSPL